MLGAGDDSGATDSGFVLSCDKPGEDVRIDGGRVGDVHRVAGHARAGERGKRPRKQRVVPVPDAHLRARPQPHRLPDPLP